MLLLVFESSMRHHYSYNFTILLSHLIVTQAHFYSFETSLPFKESIKTRLENNSEDCKSFLPAQLPLSLLIWCHELWGNCFFPSCIILLWHLTQVFANNYGSQRDHSLSLIILVLPRKNTWPKLGKKMLFVGLWDLVGRYDDRRKDYKLFALGETGLPDFLLWATAVLPVLISHALLSPFILWALSSFPIIKFVFGVRQRASSLKSRTLSVIGLFLCLSNLSKHTFF